MMNNDQVILFYNSSYFIFSFYLYILLHPKAVSKMLMLLHTKKRKPNKTNHVTSTWTNNN